MSPSHRIRRVPTKTRGVRWHLYYRLAGRASAERYDSSWPTRTLAAQRWQTILGDLAAGRPIRRAGELEAPTAQAPTIAEALDDLIAARRDVGPSRRTTYRQTRRILGVLAEQRVDQVTPAAIRGWVGDLAEHYAPKTVDMHLGVVRQVLDHVERTPNPARHRTVKAPRARRAAPKAPRTDEWHRILDALHPRHRLVAQLLEATGLRIGEAQALTWGALDLHGRRILVAEAKTHAGTRWVPLPGVLAHDLAALLPPEDRDHTRPVFPGLSAQTIRGAMTRACRAAETPHYSPHNLRHRYVSMLVAAGTPLPVVQSVVGHASAAMTLGVYAHVMVDENPARLAELRRDAERVLGAHQTPPVHDVIDTA